MTDCSENIMA